jgi:hypothetical protein
MARKKKKETPAPPASVTYLSKENASLKRERKGTVIDRVVDALLERDGKVTPEALVEAARDPDSPAHPYFDWDDSVAAVKWRLAQATSMIMATKMVAVLEDERSAAPRATPHEPVRKLLSAFRGEGYQLRPDALRDVNSRSAIIEKEIAKLRSWCRATVDIDELGEIRSTISALIEAHAPATAKKAS